MLSDTNIKNSYNIAVQNRYQELMKERTPQETDDTETQCASLRDSMTKAAEEVLPKKTWKQKQPWMTKTPQTQTDRTTVNENLRQEPKMKKVQ